MRPFVFGLVLATVAFGLRIGFTLAYRGDLNAPPIQAIAGYDSVEYDLLARQLVAGKGYTWENGSATSFRAPGFPIVLAIVYAILGQSYPVAYAFLALCGSVGAVTAYLLGRELRGEAFGRLVGGLAAIYPPDIYSCSYFFSEVVFVPCLGGGLWLLVRYIRTESRRAILGAGILLGYAALTRSFAVLILPIFVVYLSSNRRQPQWWLGVVLFAAGFLAVALPWTARNYLVFDRFVLIATNGGSTFYGANNDVVADHPWLYGNWVWTNILPGRDLIDAQPDEVSLDKKEWELGIDWVKHHPLKFGLLAPFKVVRFWLPFVHWPSLKVYPVANILFTAPFLLVIAIGMLRTIAMSEGRRQFAVLHLTMLANIVMVVIFWGDPRFRDANMPVLMVYAAVGGLWLADWTQSFYQRRGTIPTLTPN